MNFAVTCYRCGLTSAPSDFLKVEAEITPESAADGEAEITVCELRRPRCTNVEEVEFE